MIIYSTFMIIPEVQQQKNDAILTLNGELSPFRDRPHKTILFVHWCNGPFSFYRRTAMGWIKTSMILLHRHFYPTLQVTIFNSI